MPLTTTSTLVGFPDAQSTGVRDGVTLKQVGDMVVTTAGAVISGLEIHGTLRIEADNVTVRDCKIVNEGGWHGILIPDGNTGAVVEFCDIIGPVNGISGTGTFRFNDFSSNDNGINVYGPSLIVDNYIHDMNGGADAHYDGIEINGGGGTTIRHNTIINDHSQTSAVMIDNYFGAVPGIIIDNNYLAGGGYTIYSDGRFSSTDPITGVQISNNYLGQGYWGYYAFWDNSPLVSGNHELGRTWPTPVSDGSTPPPEPTSTILSFSSDSGVLGDGITNDNTLTFSGTAAANSTVMVFDGTTQLGAVTANGSGAWSYTTDTLSEAAHSFTAKATDAAGNTSAASSVMSITVDGIAPTKPVIASFSTDTGTVGDGITNDPTLTLTGTAEANSSVAVYDGGALLGTAAATGGGSWSYTTGTLSDGTHSFKANATDAAGNTSVASAELAVTVDTVAGSPEPTPITGTSGNDVLMGTIGADILIGYVGDDTYRVNSTGDKVVELANEGIDKVESTISYTLSGNVENLQLMGDAKISGAGNDLDNTIIGNDVSNSIEGNAGNDTLNGWGDKDTFFGGSGNDVFQFSSQFSADGDKVMDFIHGVDKLDFSKIDANAYRSGDQAFIFDGYGSSGSNRHLWVVEDQAAGVTHLYGKTGDFEFHVDLQGVHLGLTTSDFIL
jgi:Ca2+-binding RTX toxin-like protein